MPMTMPPARRIKLKPGRSTMRSRMPMPMDQQQGNPPDLMQPVPLPIDASTVSPHERDVARFQSEDARTGVQTDEVPPTVIRRGRKAMRSGPLDIPSIMKRMKRRK